MKRTLKDAIYGFAIGDALGVPVEFCERNKFHVTDMTEGGHWKQPKGTWSDDTSMTLATCDSIREKGCVDCQDLFNKFWKWASKGDYAVNGNVFDIGGTTLNALMTGIAPDDFYSNGNGALMRMLPLAFVEVNAELVSEVSAITHGHQISQDICCNYVAIAKALLNGKRKDEIIQMFNLMSIVNRQVDEVKSSGFVVDTFEAVMWCIFNTDSFEDAVLTAVNLGSDTDTVGAITGGLAGIIYGFDAIPKRWIDDLRGKEIIEKCLF